MIRLEDVTVTYAGAVRPALRGVTAHVEEGELCLVVGPTGSGKSTLLGAASGRVPHFTGGLLTGHAVVDGRDTRDHRPRDLADVVGVVGQDPRAGFVTDTVEEELAFSLEQLGVTPGIMRKRVEEVLDLLSLAPLRSRALADLSGGEQQRVAIGAVMTAQPRILVLDEPTSALDPTAAEEVLAALSRVVHDLGVTVLLAEHRLERVVQFADRVISLDVDGRAVTGAPTEVLVRSAVAPPVVELGRLAGWDPLPMSVRDARRLARPLRDRLVRLGAAAEPGELGAVGDGGTARPAPASDGHRLVAGPLLSARGLVVRHGAVHALRGVDLDLRPGELVAVMGRNGSGKSSLLWALQGQGPRSGGSVRVGLDGDAADPAGLRPQQARRRIALVPQSPSDLLYLDAVGAECAAGDEQAGAEPGTVRAALDRLVPGVAADAHPRDLSEGQRLGLALAVQLAARPAVVLLDEPTRGLDYAAKDRLTRDLADLSAAGAAVLLSSHDVEFVAGFADRVLVLADGEVVADGPAAEVLVASPTFAPQVAKILHPLSLLTVGDVRRSLAVTA